MTTRVVNIRKTNTWDIYIGRRAPLRHLSASPWANPYVIGKDGGRTEVIEKYRAYLLGRPDLLARLPALRGKVLGCFCAPPGGLTVADPLVCHGQLIAELCDVLEVTE